MLRYLFALSALLALTVTNVWALEFDHAGHMKNPETPKCTFCHSEDAHSIRPEPVVCRGCHEQSFVDEVRFAGLKTHDARWLFEHRPSAVGQGIDCSFCHEQSFCLECHKAGRADELGQLGNTMLNVHRSEFRVTHPIYAKTDPQLCSGCHESQFCSECHANFAPADIQLLSHRRGWTNVDGGVHIGVTSSQCFDCHDQSVIEEGDWSASHAREARKNLATCQACHPDGDICLRCHSATGFGVNPHPSDWNDIKDRLEKASDGRTCRKCH
jgi:hypothetical protein